MFLCTSVLHVCGTFTFSYVTPHEQFHRWKKTQTGKKAKCGKACASCVAESPLTATMCLLRYACWGICALTVLLLRAEENQNILKFKQSDNRSRDTFILLFHHLQGPTVHGRWVVLAPVHSKFVPLHLMQPTYTKMSHIGLSPLTSPGLRIRSVAVCVTVSGTVPGFAPLKRGIRVLILL